MTDEEFNNLVESSRYILDFKENWDDEGSPVYSEKTFNRAINYLREHVRLFQEESGLPLGVPRILPGPDGSIDIFWDYATYDALLNVPADENKPVTFFGEYKGVKEKS